MYRLKAAGRPPLEFLHFMLSTTPALRARPLLIGGGEFQPKSPLVQEGIPRETRLFI